MITISTLVLAAATALALSIGFLGTITWQTLGWFISVSSCSMMKATTSSRADCGRKNRSNRSVRL